MSPRRVTMSGRPDSPTVADAWVRDGEARSPQSDFTRGEIYTARLTIDVTPELRSRIKVAAFRQGITVADLLRALLEREIPPDDESARGRR